MIHIQYHRAIDLLDSWLENLSDEEIEENSLEVRQVIDAIILLEKMQDENKRS